MKTLKKQPLFLGQRFSILVTLEITWMLFLKTCTWDPRELIRYIFFKCRQFCCVAKFENFPLRNYPKGYSPFYDSMNPLLSISHYFIVGEFIFVFSEIVCKILKGRYIYCQKLIFNQQFQTLRGCVFLDILKLCWIKLCLKNSVLVSKAHASLLK